MTNNNQYFFVHTTKGFKLAVASMNGQINLQSIFGSIDPLCPPVAAYAGTSIGKHFRKKSAHNRWTICPWCGRRSNWTSEPNTFTATAALHAKNTKSSVLCSFRAHIFLVSILDILCDVVEVSKRWWALSLARLASAPCLLWECCTVGVTSFSRLGGGSIVEEVTVLWRHWIKQA